MRIFTPIAAIAFTLLAISACDDSLQSPTEYENEPSFIVLVDDTDSDNDGVPDVDDFWPDSDNRELVDIDGCSPQVANVVVQDGATIMDLVNTCLQDSKPAKCLHNLLRDLRKSGAITKGEWKALMKCVGKQ